jgi:ESCRT-I complex subunit TSG101
MAKQQIQLPTSAPAPPPVPPPPTEYRRATQIMATPSPELRDIVPPLPPKRDSNESVNRGPVPSNNRGPPIPPLPPKQPSGYIPSFQLTGSEPDKAPNSRIAQSSYVSVSSRSPLPPHIRHRYSHELESPVSPMQAEPPKPLQNYQPQSSQVPYTPRQPSNVHPGGYFHPHAQPHRLPMQPQQPAQPKAAPPPIDLLTSSLDDIIPSSQAGAAPTEPPPIPPNPEKDALLHALSQMLVVQTHQAISSNENAVVSLRAQDTALRNAHSALMHEMQQVSELDAALDSNERVLRGAMHEAERVMQDARGRRKPEVDELLVCPTVVGSQLYATVAEEKACEEARLALGRLLDAGRIPVEVFVRQSRTLGREVYRKKALGRKIAKGMALDERKW